MHGLGTATRLKRLALVFLLSVATVSTAAAQPPAAVSAAVEAALIPGTTVWITDFDGMESKARILSLADDVVTITAGDRTRSLRTRDVARVKVRRSDSLLNGALIGAGAAVASGLLLCRLTEPWENCRDDIGPMFRIGVVGTGIGIGIDALIRGRKTIYEAPGAPTLHVAPLIGRRAAGMQLSFTF
jgi:hypothetical protein